MLGIALEKVCDLIQRVEAFDAGLDGTPGAEAPDRGSDLIADHVADAVSEEERDPARNELVEYIDGLNLDEQINLVALTWVGRGTFEIAEWQDALQEARDGHTDHTGDYLVGIPLLGTYLEEGLSQMGLSCD